MLVHIYLCVHLNLSNVPDGNAHVTFYLKIKSCTNKRTKQKLICVCCFFLVRSFIRLFVYFMGKRVYSVGIYILIVTFHSIPFHCIVLLYLVFLIFFPLYAKVDHNLLKVVAWNWRYNTQNLVSRTSEMPFRERS